MTDRYDEWRSFYAEKVDSWMSLEELRAECGMLHTEYRPIPEALLIHAMHALEELQAEVERLRRGPHPAITHCDDCGCDWLDNGLNPIGCPYCKLSTEAENEKLREALKDTNDEAVFIDGVGAARSSVKSCRGGVQWIRVGDRVYWPLSESDAKRLQSACCGNGSFDGPTMPTVEGVNND